MDYFNTRRRERFLNQLTYGNFVAASEMRREKLQTLIVSELPARDHADSAFAQWTVGIANHCMELLIGRYSAGDDIASLAKPFVVALAAMETSSLPHSMYQSEPFFIDSVDGYTQALWLLSLCKLLRLDPLLPRVMAVFDVAREDNRRQDALFETLVAKLGGEPEEVKPAGAMFKMLKAHPLLYKATQAEPAKRPLLMAEFLKKWYPAMKGCYWYNIHSDVPQNFFGYWAFEAGLVTYLWDIDDSGYRNLPFYPKDMVDYARAHPRVDTAALIVRDEYPSGTENRRPSIPTGQPCPEAGWWFTPAKSGSRRYFKQGEAMPSVGGDYGDTFWQWSPDQSAPSL